MDATILAVVLAFMITHIIIIKFFIRFAQPLHQLYLIQSICISRN